MLKVCFYFSNEDGDTSNINHTLLAFILKTNNLKKVTEFRLVSLRNVIYNIMSKVIANRIKYFLDYIVNLFQTAFIRHRLITNSVVIGYKYLHRIQSKRKGKLRS